MEIQSFIFGFCSWFFNSFLRLKTFTGIKICKNTLIWAYLPPPHLRGFLKSVFSSHHGEDPGGKVCFEYSFPFPLFTVMNGELNTYYKKPLVVREGMPQIKLCNEKMIPQKPNDPNDPQKH
jgi:hypothetical protein